MSDRFGAATAAACRSALFHAHRRTSVDRRLSKEGPQGDCGIHLALFRFRVWFCAVAPCAARFDLVDDLVQEIFLAAWESIHQFQGAGPLQGWLLGIARHKVEDHYRALLRAPEATPEAELESLAGAMMPDFNGALDQAQLQEKTWRVMSSLHEQYRMALVWRYWDKISAREMAARLGKTEKAVERLLARARQQFRERWGDA